MISSFDIFDTCLVRKCGTPECFFDVFSLRAFNEEIEEWVRQEFVAARRLAERSLWDNSYYTLQEIWEAFTWNHPLLKSKDELCQLEQDMEREMLVPVLSMLDKVNACRKKGDKIVFISDMYLPSEFLVDVMRRHGFYQDGDSIYVSCECKAAKYDGALFRYVKDKEGLKSYRRWHHYGDNEQSDYKVLRKLGIKATLVNHKYTPYQKKWLDNDCSNRFKFQSIMAGVGRSIHYCTIWTAHTDFVLDMIAPFYCSLVYRMMKDAEKHGIKRLYFCARDAYVMYLIAMKYKSLFPSIDCVFLYISRKALYEGEDTAKIEYYKSIGLATKEDCVGIVDIRSTGKTLVFLNEYLKSKGYRQVRGYYFELFIYFTDIRNQGEDYYCEINGLYAHQLSESLASVWQIWENFFSMNMVPKTVGYTIEQENAKPIYGKDETDGTQTIDRFYIVNHDFWCKVHEDLVMKYADMYMSLFLFRYSDEIFNHICLPAICSFVERPHREYAKAIVDLFGVKTGSSGLVPFIKKESWLRLLFTRGKDTYWQNGTLVYNHFVWGQTIYWHFKK